MAMAMAQTGTSDFGNKLPENKAASEVGRLRPESVGTKREKRVGPFVLFPYSFRAEHKHAVDQDRDPDELGLGRKDPRGQNPSTRTDTHWTLHIPKLLASGSIEIRNKHGTRTGTGTSSGKDPRGQNPSCKRTTGVV